MERVTEFASVAVLVVAMGGALLAWLHREVAAAVVLLIAGTTAFFYLANYTAFSDWVESGILGATSPESAGPKPQDSDGSLWLPLALAGGGLANVGLYGLWGRIRRWRARRSASRASVATMRERRHAIEAEHDEVRDAYAAYICDILAVLDRPALDDVTVPQTAALLHDMDTAADTRRGSDLNAYRRAVSALKTSWRAADEHARKSGVRYLPAEERSTIATARRLFEKALDEHGSEHERQAAHAKARALLDGVLTLPKQAVAAVEHQVRPALTRRSTA
ncbi:hypothetical protein [Streptomyces albidoflavus]|uniref:hypothetical protein n=2 Tax=Streptomyces TaxID=1883 RepID=UPI00343ED392